MKIFLLLAVLLLCSACGGGSVEGMWRGNIPTEEEYDADMTLLYDADQRFYLRATLSVFDLIPISVYALGTWEQSGGTIKLDLQASNLPSTLDTKNPAFPIVAQSDQELTLQLNGGQQTLYRLVDADRQAFRREVQEGVRNKVLHLLDKLRKEEGR